MSELGNVDVREVCEVLREVLVHTKDDWDARKLNTRIDSLLCDLEGD